MIQLTNSVCEALICGVWRLIPVESLHGSTGILRRCPECHASIKLMKLGKEGQHPYFEHEKRNPDCSLISAKGKAVKYVHSSVNVSEKDREDSEKFESLLPLCISNSEVINDGEVGEDVIAAFESSLSDLEKRQEIDARVGLGKFRQEVVNVWGSETCALTLTPVKEMLVASHIKVWRNCESTAERLEGANGILLCAHIDKLFEKHRITFKKVGREFRLKLADDLDRMLMTQLGLNEGDALATGRMNAADLEKFEDNLAHHQKIFNQINEKEIV
ncbi:HNH endonuclease [Shewanella sp. KX20019]|uniref:HNH endonuclease signature motif containing protein n=1 Tax=Shewanella sp. KX20019 TaxID=2803864 RepID=UPI0019267F0F|nr:HNH endonuclease signature motif containing protein [Shewanella sp. KX20019]QQX81733.1 HNH endonuclease [Shewanella sp. KX20019]